MLLLEGPPPSWSVPSWITIILLGLGALVNLGALYRLRLEIRRSVADDAERKKQDQREYEQQSLRVCREYTNAKEFRETRDQRIRELADERVDLAFTRRASSFVSTDKFDERTRSIERKQQEHEDHLTDNTKAIGEVAGRIDQSVRTQITALMQMLQRKDG